MSLYNVLSRCDNKVAEVFSKLTKDVDKEKMNKIVNSIEELEKSGKSLERSMADSLEIYKLDGAIRCD